MRVTEYKNITRIFKFRPALLSASRCLSPAGRFLITVLFLLTLTQCSTTKIDNTERGADYNYRPGYPELRATASGYLDDDDNGEISVTAEVVYGSLIYKKQDEVFTAKIDYEINIIDLNNNNAPVINETYPGVIENSKASVIHSQETQLFEKAYAMQPGNYLVTITLTDQSTDKSSRHAEQIYIPNPLHEVSNVTNIQILSKSNTAGFSDFKAETTYDIPSAFDSLKFVFQITNNKPDNPITIRADLLKFKSDSSVARPMTYSDYYPSSMPYKGIDYGSSEIVNSTRRVLTDPGSVLIEFVFPMLEKGNYRLEVQSEGSDDDTDLYRARDFSIKGANYPSLKTPRELAEPLIYLMSDKEYKAVMALSSPDSIKKAVDRFWLSNIKNSRTAAEVIALYYERVEEANKQFSNFKEGWKTDMGMIYILFGPPWYVDKSLDQMRWSYSYNMTDPEKNFYFRTPKIKNKYFPFDNYLLMRSNGYYNVQYQQIELWLSGLILSRV